MGILVLWRGMERRLVRALVELTEDSGMKFKGIYISRKGLEFILIRIEFFVIKCLCLQRLEVQRISTLESSSIVGRMMPIFLYLRRFDRDSVDVEEITLV